MPGLGLAYSLDTILEAADLLRARTDLAFLIIGAGPRETALRRRLAELELPAVQTSVTSPTPSSRPIFLPPTWR